MAPLRSRASFGQLSKNGRRRQGTWCWVRYSPFPATAREHDGLEVGFAISRKIGNAVLRNRIRRRLRPIIVDEAPRLPPGIYLVGVKNGQAAQASYEELRNDIYKVLHDASAARTSSTD